MSAHYIAALDQGTTSTRCMIFDRQGRMVALAQREHRQYYPHSGWVEHDADEIWGVVRRILPQALHDAGVGPEQIAGLGITNQRETSVLWNRHTGKPVSRAIVWQDTRTAELLPRIAEDLDPAVISDLSGLPLVNYFSGPKIRTACACSPKRATCCSAPSTPGWCGT
jgi:glycerol kinase